VQRAVGVAIKIAAAGFGEGGTVSLGVYFGVGAGQGAVAGRVVVGPAVEPGLLLGNGVNNGQVVVIFGQLGRVLADDDKVGPLGAGKVGDVAHPPDHLLSRVHAVPLGYDHHLLVGISLNPIQVDAVKASIEDGLQIAVFAQPYLALLFVPVGDREVALPAVGVVASDPFRVADAPAGLPVGAIIVT